VRGTVNGYSINGAALPNWVVRAVVVAAAAATVANVNQTRITFGSALADAGVVVTLTQTQTIQARSNATATASSSLSPTLLFAGRSTAFAEATGNGAVIRDVFASAGGDATCTAEALTAQAIGAATATMESSVVLAKPHLIRPGASLRYGELSSSVTGNVTRYTLIPTTNFGEASGRGEASHKIYPNNYFRHDGYVLRAMAGASSQILQDRIVTISTIGSFQFAECDGTSRSFIRYSARSLATGITTRLQASAIHIQRGRVNALAQANITANALRTRQGAAVAFADVAPNAPRARILQASRASASAAAVVSVTQRRTAFAAAVSAAQSAVPFAILYGTQHRTTVNALAETTGIGLAFQRFAGTSLSAIAELQARSVDGYRVAAGSVSTTMASATVGRAFGLTNSEVLAPDDRYMRVSAEERAMAVAIEERTMMVTA